MTSFNYQAGNQIDVPVADKAIMTTYYNAE